MVVTRKNWALALMAVIPIVGLGLKVEAASPAQVAFTALLTSTAVSPSSSTNVDAGAPTDVASSTPKVKGNNGVGNGVDPQPPGNPPINDGPGTSPGNPGNKGGAKK